MRFVLASEANRNLDCTPGADIAIQRPDIELAADVGAALHMPSSSTCQTLEACDADDFVLWQGDWECFRKRTEQWPESRMQARIHRLALLDESRSDVQERLERIKPAFALPFHTRTAKRGEVGGVIYGRKEVVSVLGLDTTDFSETQHYRIVYSQPKLTLAQLVARYLEKYWELFGQ